LLTDFTRPAHLALDGGQVAFQLQPGLVNRLRSLARAKSVTLFALLLGLFAMVLARWAGAKELAIASPVGHRQGSAVEPLIGYFVWRPFRALAVDELLLRLHSTMLGAFSHSSTPYAKVLEAAGLDPAAVPALFVLQDRNEAAWSMEAWILKALGCPLDMGRFVLPCVVEGLRVEQVEIKRRLQGILAACMQSKGMTHAKFQPTRGTSGREVYNKQLWTESRVVSSNSRARVLEWGGHNRAVQAPTPLIKALKVQLLQCQQESAILVGDRAVSYSELQARVVSLASALRQRPELQSQSLETSNSSSPSHSSHSSSELLVALLLPRSVDLAVAIWATLSVAAYVPVDPEYPAERVSHILSSAQPRLVLMRKEHEQLAGSYPIFGTWQWPDIDAKGSLEELRQPAPQQLAYVIYTSGSTGQPKGVAIEHRSAANMVHQQLALMRIKRQDRVLQFFKPAFDGAVQEYLSTFLAGACLVIWDESEGESFAEALENHRVTAATLTPSALAVLNPSNLPALATIAVAAETCPPSLVNLWTSSSKRMLNAYGPSENTVVTTWAELNHSNETFILRSFDSLDTLTSAPVRQEQVPIGTPLAGVQCYVFEATAVKSLQAIGTPGELCIGGVQLARGYFGDAAKTAEKFVTNPLLGQKIERMYKTGDIVTWLPQGQLLYLGRNDEMVKVRGFRIELAEVEAALAALGAQAVAVAVNAAKDGLWAWVTPRSLSPKTLRAELLKTLPQYMVPTRIASLETFPLTPNGKIDKARLLAESCSEVHLDGLEGPAVEPCSALEHRLCATAAAVLGLETLGVTMDLRSAGMTSLKAVLLSQKLRDIGLTLPLAKLYELQTVRAVAEHLSIQEEVVLGALNEADVESGRCDLGRKGCVGLLRSFTVLCWRLLVWVWISGVVIWPAMLPLKFSSRLAETRGAAWSLAFMVLVGYPFYLLSMVALVICTKWLLIGQYRAGAFPVDSWAFLRWWAVDRLVVFVNELSLGAFRGGVLYFLYLKALGLRATGYCRIDTRHVSEPTPRLALFDLITLGRCCVVAEGAKLRPAAAEAGVLHLRPLAFGDHCAVGENAVCTAGCAVGEGVTLQPLSMLSGRTGRTLPDGSVWKGALLVQSRQQPIRVPVGLLCHDLLVDAFALILTLLLQTACSLGAYCSFGLLAEVQGFGLGEQTWQWQAQPEGYLFAATWLLFGPPVMASADVLLGLDLAGLADQVSAAMGIGQWQLGLRLAGMVVLSFAVYGWSLTVSSALLCRYIRGSRNLNSWFFQVRRVVLRLTFPRYPAQIGGTWALSMYFRLLGGRVSLRATVAVSEPPLEPRKLHVAEGALLLTHQALGECEVGKGSIVGAGAVLLPHSQVEPGAVVGAMSVAGRPVRSGLQLVGNPGVIMRMATLNQEPTVGWARQHLRRSVKILYPLLAPMFLQMLLLTTLLPAMYFLTVLLDFLAHSSSGSGLMLAFSLPAAYVALGWCLCLLAVLVHRLLSVFRPGSWCEIGSVRHHLVTFSEQLNAMSLTIFMGMALGSPFYNFWLKAMGAQVAKDALLLTAILGDYRWLTVGQGASVDKEAVSARWHPCLQSRAELLSDAIQDPPANVARTRRSAAIHRGLPPQAFGWSKLGLVKPSSRQPPVLLPAFVSRAIGRMKVLQSQQGGEVVPLVSGSTGFLGRSLVAALLESGACSRIVCLVRAADPAAAERRVLEALERAGTSHLDLSILEAVPGDLQQRNFGRPFAEVQRLAGRVTHVIHAAAKVNLTEPFDLMKKDNVDATAHLLEFCCVSRPKPFHHVSTMGILTPDMLDRNGVVPEGAPLGDIRSLPMYGTGDQANGYPQSKWLAERLVFEAARQGLPCYIHRPGLIGGHSATGAAAEDVFFHFLSDVLKLQRLPAMEGRKFNLTPVDWVAKAIVRILLPGWLETRKLPNGSVFHPAMPNNEITTDKMAAVLKRVGRAGFEPGSGWFCGQAMFLNVEVAACRKQTFFRACRSKSACTLCRYVNAV
ncbi:tycB, partial [Symbiodinium pilosum]